MVRCVSFKEDRIGSFDARDDARTRGDARARWKSIVKCAFARTGRRGTRAREDTWRKSEDMVEIAGRGTEAGRGTDAREGRSNGREGRAARAGVRRAKETRAMGRLTMRDDAFDAGPDRKLYLPGGLLTKADLPSYLDGTLAGDYGFDPLGLGADGAIKQYRVAEVIHARWAMLAIPGVVIPEALGLPGGVWTETGKVFLDGETGRPFFLENPIVFAAIQVALMAGVEQFRSSGEGPAGFVPFKGKFDESAFKGLDPINPGGPLDFFNVASNPQDLALLKVKEIKNGRLAMIAMLGVFVQGLTTGEGPAANWGKHVADPFGT